MCNYKIAKHAFENMEELCTFALEQNINVQFHPLFEKIYIWMCPKFSSSWIHHCFLIPSIITPVKGTFNQQMGEFITTCEYDPDLPGRLNGNISLKRIKYKSRMSFINPCVLTGVAE